MIEKREDKLPAPGDHKEEVDLPEVQETVQLLAREAGVDQIGELAFRRGLVSPRQLEECLQMQVSHPSKMLGQILIQKGFVAARQLVDLLQEQLRRVPLYRKVGRYALQGVLGEGSCGVVFLARDYRLGRKVALKILRTDSSEFGERVRQFQKEAHNAAQLNHPNIVTIHDAGQEGALCYIAMERILGQSISRWSSGRRGKWKAICRVLRKVGQALQHAHDRGVIHRDLKSRNILVDREGSPHLLDFSLSRAVGEETDYKDVVNIIGTPAYMSPEQVEGRVGDVDARSDIFSFGVVMFEVLTGRLPFEGDTVMDLFRQIREEDPAAVEGVPEELIRICHRALQKNPDDRYQKVREILYDLNGFLEAETRPFLRRRVGGMVRQVRNWLGLDPAGKALRPSALDLS